MSNAQERREWYKAHGICVACGHADAWNGRQKCAACLEKATLYYIKHGPPKRDSAYNARCRDRYAQRVAAGLCVRCGKPQYHGTLCYEHYIEKLKINDRAKAERRARGNPRKMWVQNGMCWYCGKPAMPDYRVCEQHYRHLEYARRCRKNDGHPLVNDEHIRRSEEMNKNGD